MKEGEKLVARERKKRGRVKKKKTNKNIGLVVRDYYTFCRTWYVPWEARDDGEWYLARGVLGRVRERVANEPRVRRV